MAKKESDKQDDQNNSESEKPYDLQGDAFLEQFPEIYKATLKVRKIRIEKLNSCMENAFKSFHEFLDDPERVTAYNEHVDRIIDDYDTSSLGADEKYLLGSLKIYPSQIQNLKNINLKTSFKEKLEDPLVIRGGTLTGFEEIQTTEDFFDYFSSDEMSRNLVHEIGHAFSARNYLDHGKGDTDKLMSRERSKTVNHIMELAFDSLGEFVQPLPGGEQLQRKLQMFISGGMSIAGKRTKKKIHAPGDIDPESVSKEDDQHPGFEKRKQNFRNIYKNTY